VEPGEPEARLQGCVGDGAIAEYPATGSGYAGACKVISGESCRGDARPRRRKGTPGEMARSQWAISNSAAADARAANRMAGKSQTPAAASKAPSTASDVPAEAATSAAPSAWTGFRCVGDRGNCEEQDRGGDKASHEVSLGGRGHFQCRCARRRHEEVIVFLRIESARCRHEQNAEMAHGPVPPKFNNLRSLSLSVQCDKRKEKDGLFVGAGRATAASMTLLGPSPTCIRRCKLGTTFRFSFNQFRALARSGIHHLAEHRDRLLQLLVAERT
jgi:hypothetical protein